MRRGSIRVWSTAALFCLAFGHLAGCGGGEPPESVLVRVGDSTITLDDFRREWSNQPPIPPGVPPESVERFLEDMIAEKLFLAEARRRKIDQEEDLRQEVERYREQLMVERLLSREVLTAPPPSPVEVEGFWAANQELFAVPELTRLSHILIRTGEEVSEEAALERCREIQARLENGEDFAAVARQVSESDNADRGGDLGYLSEEYIERVIPAFQPVVRELEAGEVSGSIKTDFGYHLLKVTDAKPPRQKTLEESREEIAAALLAKKRKARFEKVRAGIAASVSVEKNRKLIESLQEEQSKAFSLPEGTVSGSR